MKLNILHNETIYEFVTLTLKFLYAMLDIFDTLVLVTSVPNIISAGNYMFKVNNRNPRTKCETCSKLTIKIQDFVVNFEKVNAGWDLFLHVK